MSFAHLPSPETVLHCLCASNRLLAGGAFAFAPLVWLYAVQAEVFALNNAISALLLLLLVRFERSRSLGAACAGACAIGLALTNQHTLVLLWVGNVATAHT